MFFTYLRRELRRRMRQAVIISLGLALGIGLVITVIAASDGVKNSQAAVLHSLYGVGTNLTVTQPPKRGSAAAIAVEVQQQIKRQHGGVLVPGDKINVNDLLTGPYGTLSSDQLSTVARQPGVRAAVGGLTLIDFTMTGKLPRLKNIGQGGGSVKSSFRYTTFTVDGVDVANGALGPLGSGKVTSGTTFTSADAQSNVAVVDSNYAAQKKLGVNETVNVGGTSFKIIGLVSAPQGGRPPNVYIPLAKAQSIGKNGSSRLANEIDTIYVSAASAADIRSVQKEIRGVLPTATITDQNDLASEVTGSLTSASGLANKLGKWLSIAVLIASFLLAGLLTMAAVARRVREFGMLKALGWRSRRIIGQVMGESIVIGIIGGALGVGLGYGGAALIDKMAPKLSATVGSANTPSVMVPPGDNSGMNSAIKALTSSVHTVSVTLTAPVTVRVILIAVALAVAGGFIAGSFGSWRAARLRPAAALAKVG
ncbi:MAG TPA: ABC transporter permease [Streptosporangiaceae bacterium]